MDIKANGTVTWSAKDQHRIMKSNEPLIQQRMRTLKSARPDLKEEDLRKKVLNNFEIE